MFTNFPDGITSFGVPIFSSGGPLWKPTARVWFVRPDAGLGQGDGRSPDSPLLLMQTAFNNIRSGDIICFDGNIREQLTTPAGVFDVTIVGLGNSPRHADLHTVTGGYSAATWRGPTSPTAATPLLKVQQQGWRFMNFLFTGGAAASPAVDLFRDGGADSLERDGGHATFYNMRFDACPLGIRNNGGVGFVGIYNSFFRGMTTTAIAHTVGAGIGQLGWWDIAGNRFVDNVNHIVAPLYHSTVHDNIFGPPGTLNIDLTNGAANTVGAGNTFHVKTSYDADNEESGTDSWLGNFLAAGLTTANPS